MPFRRSGESRATRKPNKISSAFGARAQAGELARPEESESFLFKNAGLGSNDFAIPKERINVALSFPNLGNTRRGEGRTGRYRFVTRRAARCLPAPLLWTESQQHCSSSKYYHVLPSLELSCGGRRIPRLIFDMGWAGLGRGQGTVGWALLGQGHGRTNSLPAAWAGDEHRVHELGPGMVKKCTH